MTEEPIRPTNDEPATMHDQIVQKEPYGEQLLEHRYRLTKTSRIIWLILGILEVLLGLRFLMKLLAANPQAAFAQLLYGLTDLFVFPFQAVFPTPSVGRSVFETASLLAMLVYALIAWGIVRILWVVTDRPPTPRP